MLRVFAIGITHYVSSATGEALSIGREVAASALPADQILRMATINGAKALGIDDRVGTLEPGKQADMIAVDLGDLLVQPVYDPISHLVYNTSGRQVTHTWVAGEPRLIEGELQRMDLHGLRERVNQWQRHIAEADKH